MVDLWCPNCNWREEVMLDEAQVERLDVELDNGFDRLADDFERMVAAHMREYAERFVAALGADALLPEDF